MPSSIPYRRALALLEVPRVSLEMAQLSLFAPWLLSVPRGDRHPVMLLPGFIASDRSTALLRAYLDSLGYQTRGWQLGRNLGLQRAGGMTALLDAFDAFHAEQGQPVSLVGWSLGGVYARRIARRRPDAVRQVISLGSPIAGDPEQTAVWRVYESVNGEPVARDAVRRFMAAGSGATNVPATAIYSRTDGIVPWQMAREPAAPKADNIEVAGSHTGLGFNALVYYLVANRLAQPVDAWQPFNQADPVYRLARLTSWEKFLPPMEEAG